MTSVKVLVTSVKELVTLGKTKTGIPSGARELYQVCFANGSCLDVKDLSEWVLLGMISIWMGWTKLCLAARMPPEILNETEL